MSKENMIAGGWTTYSTSISADAKEVWDKALHNFVGVNYTPLAVATQVVNGINYRFLCNASIVIPNALNRGALVSIHQSLNGSVEITDIQWIPFGD